jgi:transglutaminase-like putative cysteine protease/type II secretory pathway component PulJ
LAAHRQSSYVIVTRALLTGGATLALARVYSGASWVAPLLLAAALPALILTLGERRRWNPFVTIGGTLVVGAWLAILVDDPSETIAGLPTASALATLGHDLSNAPHVLRSAVVPVDPVGAALTLAVVATFVAALATELIARRLEAPIGAIGPSIALYVAMCALGSGRWEPTTAVYAIVVVEYLVALQHTELETRRTWFQSTHNRRSQLVAGGALAGALAVAVAVTIGPGVPGARGGAWIKYRGAGEGHGSSILNVTSPLVSVGAKLNGRDNTTEVFTVETNQESGDYWRVIALDQFKDDGWGLASDQRPASRLPGATRGPGTEVFTQTFQLSAIDAHWLPAAYRPIRIDLPGSQVLPGSTSLFLEQALTGITYRVQSEISNPDKTILESVTFDDLRTMTDDVQLPPNFSGNARELAHTVTARAVTPYDKALALMQFFQSDPFIYDQSVDLGANAHALDQFLFKTHRGFCEQYSAAFAELARSVGLPTRVAVGYQRGTLGADGRWHVAEKDAHAWPEVWLGPTVGWYRFEPTPGRLDPVTGLGTAPRGPAAPTTTTPTTTAGPTTPTTASGTATSIPPLGIQTIQPPPPKSSSNTRGHVVTVILVVIASALLASLAFVAFLAYSAWLRTRRRRRDPDDRRRVLGAWTEALERLAAAGIIRRPATTSLEFALRQAPALGAGAAGPPLMDLARLHTAAMYSPDPPTPDDADTAWTEVDAIATALRATVPRTRRLRARWWSAARRTKPTSADDADSDDSEEDDLSPQR